MKNNKTAKVKYNIEDIYDIPFDVDYVSHSGDICYELKPHNSESELFNISIIIKNQLRLVIEVNPEKYAASSIMDMSKASIDKRKIFAEYAQQLYNRRATVSFQINDIPYETGEPELWPEVWKSYKLRVSRSPIISENDTFDEVAIISSWAAIVIGMILSLLNVTYSNESELYEGGVKRLEVNRYERNPINRELCLAANGYKCKICGFDFEKTYGEIGSNFIHVHHIEPVSNMIEASIIDPVKDLIPVCPNCHAMLHRKTPPLLPEELGRILKRQAIVLQEKQT